MMNCAINLVMETIFMIFRQYVIKPILKFFPYSSCEDTVSVLNSYIDSYRLTNSMLHRLSNYLRKL